MTHCACPDGIRIFIDPDLAGDLKAAAAYARWLPRIDSENRLGRILSGNAPMQEGGVITCNAATSSADAPAGAYRAAGCVAPGWIR